MNKPVTAINHYLLGSRGVRRQRVVGRLLYRACGQELLKHSLRDVSYANFNFYHNFTIINRHIFRFSVSIGGGAGGSGAGSSARHPTPLTALPLHELLTHLSPHEVSFFTMLDAQLDKVESFYLAREKEMLSRGELLQVQLKELDEHRKLFLVRPFSVFRAASPPSFESNSSISRPTLSLSAAVHDNSY